MRKSNVRVISLDRHRSGIVDRSDPMHSEWRVFFKLSPRMFREWDRHFQDVLAEGRKAGTLSYQYQLVRESSDASYVGPRKRRRITMAWRRLTRVSVFGIEVICPSRAEDLNRATREVARLVAKTNLAVVHAKESVKSSALAARVAAERFDTALDSIEKQIKKKTLKLEPVSNAFVPEQRVAAGGD